MAEQYRWEPLPVGSIVYLPSGEEMEIGTDRISMTFGAQGGGFRLHDDLRLCRRVPVEGMAQPEPHMHIHNDGPGAPSGVWEDAD